MARRPRDRRVAAAGAADPDGRGAPADGALRGVRSAARRARARRSATSSAVEEAAALALALRVHAPRSWRRADGSAAARRRVLVPRRAAPCAGCAPSRRAVSEPPPNSGPAGACRCGLLAESDRTSAGAGAGVGPGGAGAAGGAERSWTALFSSSRISSGECMPGFAAGARTMDGRPTIMRSIATCCEMRASMRAVAEACNTASTGRLGSGGLRRDAIVARRPRPKQRAAKCAGWCAGEILKSLRTRYAGNFRPDAQASRAQAGGNSAPVVEAAAACKRLGRHAARRVGRADCRARGQGEARAGADPVAQPAAAERELPLGGRRCRRPRAERRAAHAGDARVRRLGRQHARLRAARDGLLPEREEPRARRLREAHHAPGVRRRLFLIMCCRRSRRSPTTATSTRRASGDDVGEPKADGSFANTPPTRARARARRRGRRAARRRRAPPPSAARAARRTRAARRAPHARSLLRARARARALASSTPAPSREALSPRARARNRRPSRSLRLAPRRALARAAGRLTCTPTSPSSSS